MRGNGGHLLWNASDIRPTTPHADQNGGLYKLYGRPRLAFLLAALPVEDAWP